MVAMTDWQRLVSEAEKIVEDTLADLPEEVRNHAARIPVTMETSPSEEMEEEGVAEDTLGLFVGEPHDAIGEGMHPMPGQILLFLENIWDFAEGDLKRFREEVSVTLLHELGHYLGWDEEDLFDRGLD